MDLLAGYSDDADSGKNTPNFDRYQQISSKLDVGPMNDGSCNLEAEWESFEKMIGGQQHSQPSGVAPVGVAPPSLTLALGEAPMDLDSGDDDAMPILVKMTGSPVRKSRGSLSSSTSSSSPSSRASSVESDKSIGHNALPKAYTCMSEQTEDDENPLKEVFLAKSRSASPTKQRTSRSSSRSKSPEDTQSRSPSPLGKSPSRSKSKSPLSVEQKKSRSKSPTSKRRRSSDGRHSRSRSRDRRRRGSHSDKRRRHSRSRSHDRKRHSSRERRKHKDRHRRSSHSRDRKSGRSKGHRRSRSRDRKSSKTRDRKRSRSKSQESKVRDKRSKSRERKHSRSKSRERKHSRSRSRDRHNSSSKAKERRCSRSKDRRHSRSRSRHRSRSRDRKYRSKRYSRSRSRDRSRSYDREFPKVTRAHVPGKNKPINFKEKMRQQLFNASKLLTEQGGSVEGDPKDSQKDKIARLDASTIYKNMSTGVTPQMALLQTMAAMHQKAQEITGVAVPKYYNPAAVNPLKYAEQVQKRKLLWSKNKEKKTETEGTAQWQATAFVADNDGKMTAKFRKLMGIKEGEEQELDEEKEKEAEEIRRKQEELFYHLDKEYEFARMTTHTQRGVGLGFGSQTMQHP